MHPDFPHSLDRLFRIVRRTGRTASGEGVYTTVETALAEPNLVQAVRYYQETYAHDDRNGTEVIFTSNRGDFHVVRISRPQPRTELVPVRVA
jgi:hypothetical protein